VPWRAILLYPPFTRFLVYNAAWSVAFGGLGAFSVAYLKIAAGFPENQILALTGLSFLGGMAGLWIFRRRMDQFGSKPFILLCVMGWTIMAIAWTGFAAEKFEINFMWVLALQLGMGLGFSLINMNTTRLAMCLSPVMGRSHFFALYSVAANLTLGLSPILWGLAMDWVGDRETRWMSLTWNRYTLFFAGVAIAFVITFISALRLSEPKSKTLDSLLRDLLFITPQRALMRLWTRS
jgi:MFS family permease